LNVVENQLAGKDNKQFIVGDSTTMADFAIGGFYTNFFANPMIYKTDEWAKVLESFPYFKEYGGHFSKEMEDFLSTRASYKI
jgi:glutathione S-transferase